MAREWVVFVYDGIELFSYSKFGEFEGERESTICLLAYENGIPESEIDIEIVTR